MLYAVAGDLDAAEASFSDALEIQRRLGDDEGAGLSLGGLAQLAAGRGELAGALDHYRQSLAAFEAVGDRAEEARILAEMAWTHLRDGDAGLAAVLPRVGAGLHRRGERARRRAVADRTGGDRGGGGPFENAVQIAAAAEVQPRRKASSTSTPTRHRAASSSTRAGGALR